MMSRCRRVMFIWHKLIVEDGRRSSSRLKSSNVKFVRSRNSSIVSQIGRKDRISRKASIWDAVLQVGIIKLYPVQRTERKHTLRQLEPMNSVGFNGRTTRLLRHLLLITQNTHLSMFGLTSLLAHWAERLRTRRENYLNVCVCNGMGHDQTFELRSMPSQWPISLGGFLADI